MQVPFVDLSRQYKTIKKEVLGVVGNLSEKGAFILGDEVKNFEEEFAKYLGVKYAIGVASGTDALLLILKALGVGRGDEVITVSHTFIATTLAILYSGATPVFVDVDPLTNNIDPGKIEKAITKRTKAILPVHLYGYPAEIDKIKKISEKHHLYLLEDACQAHGTIYKGKKCGSFGVASAFSFYPAKNLGAFGDAGAVATNNKKIAETIKILRNVGQKEKYKHDLLGYNSRLDNLQAGILRIKLRHVDNWNRERRKAASYYSELLNDTVKIPYEEKTALPNYHVYSIETSKRDELMGYLASNGVSCGIHYPIPIHLQKCMQGVNYKKGNLNTTEKKAKSILSLPIFPGIRKTEIEYVTQTIKSFFKNK